MTRSSRKLQHASAYSLSCSICRKTALNCLAEVNRHRQHRYQRQPSPRPRSYTPAAIVIARQSSRRYSTASNVSVYHQHTVARVLCCLRLDSMPRSDPRELGNMAAVCPSQHPIAMSTSSAKQTCAATSISTVSTRIAHLRTFNSLSLRYS